MRNFYPLILLACLATAASAEPRLLSAAENEALNERLPSFTAEPLTLAEIRRLGGDLSPMAAQPSYSLPALMKQRMASRTRQLPPCTHRNLNQPIPACQP